MTNIRSVFTAAAWMAVSAVLMAMTFEPVDVSRSGAAAPQIASSAAQPTGRTL